MNTMKRVLCWILVAVMVLGVMPATTFATESQVVGREVVSLSGEWQFTDGDTTTTVTVPHSWGDNPVQVAKTCTYEKEIDVSAYAGKDIFLYFEAVAKVANVYVDDVLIGTHKGGYYSFTMDITAACEGKDTVTVKVEASNIDGVTVPLFSDFTFFGGMYRDAWLIAVDPAAYISNEDFGSSGVYAKALVDLENKTATIDTTVMLSNTEEAVVLAEVKDAEGTVVASAEKTVEAGENQAVVLDTITVEDAHLWQGTIDPYLYTVDVTVTVGGVELDSCEEKIGLRTFWVEDGTFYLNGEEYAVHGVGLHQDGAGNTYATTDEQKLYDLSLIEEMGANALRTSHYPHDDIVYDWADEHGFVIWNEVPNFGAMLANQDFQDGLTLNIKEMVMQGYNHPSIIIWGLENEMNAYPHIDPSVTIEYVDKFLNDMGKWVNEVDGTRMIGEAQIDQTPMAEQTALWTDADSEFDVVGLNIYTGWYGNVRGATPENKINRIVDSMQRKIAKYVDIFDASAGEGKLSYVMTEYGAGSNIEQHDDLGSDFNWGGSDATKGHYAMGPWQPEEYASYVHEGTYMAIYGDETNNIAPAENMWAGFIWAMFDFSSYRSEGGTVGINTKGMVTQDRQTKKDCFYFYKANWNTEETFTYITSKRFEARPTETIDVKVYSNCDSVELVVDGVSYGEGTLEQDHVFVWSDVALKKNETVHVEAIGTKDGETYTDTCDTWYYAVVAEINSDSDLNKEYDGEPVQEPEYTVTVEGVDITEYADVTIEWYRDGGASEDTDSENPGYEDGENPGYEDGENPGYEDGENPGYEDGENPGYEDGENPGYDYGYGSGSTGSSSGDNSGTGPDVPKLDGPPTEPGKYYCLITVKDGSNGDLKWSGSSLKIYFEITAPYDGCEGGEECGSEQFTDLAAKFAVEGYNLWWHPYTDYVIEKGLMIGMGNDIFDLNFTTNRAMVTMVLWRLAGAPETAYVDGTYDDVSAEQWFAEPVAWATNVDIVEGYGDGNFGPADAMKREDIVNMFYRYWQYIEGSNPGYYPTSSGSVGSGENPGYDEDPLAGFVDAGDVSEYAYEAMCWAVENGLVIGDDNNCLVPQGSVERAELATFLTRWCEDIAK